jgi:hypothetical protein
MGLLITQLMPPGATLMLGADDTAECRSGRQIIATGYDRDTVRSTKLQVIRCFGLKWVSILLLLLVPWSRRVWALPFLTARFWPTEKRPQRRHKSSVEWVRKMMELLRRWLPGLCVVMVSCLRWDAALYHRPGSRPPGKRGPILPRASANAA